LRDHKAGQVYLWFSPLSDYGEFVWYAAPLPLMPDAFRLVVCDGPPGGTRGGRVGLLSVIGDRVPAGAVILLDDAARDGERHAVSRWMRAVRLEVEWRQVPGGTFAEITRCWRRPSAPRALPRWPVGPALARRRATTCGGARGRCVPRNGLRTSSDSPVASSTRRAASPPARRRENRCSPSCSTAMRSSGLPPACAVTAASMIHSTGCTVSRAALDPSSCRVAALVGHSVAPTSRPTAWPVGSRLVFTHRLGDA